MTRFPIILALAAATMLPAPAAGQKTPIQLEAGAVSHITLDADTYDTGPDMNPIQASGHVTAIITQPEADGTTLTTTVTADALQADMQAQTLSAQGNVMVVSNDHAAHGDSLEYRWAARTGTVTGVVSRQYGITFRAATLELAPKRQVVVDTSFTACGADDPSYTIHAKRVTIIPNRRITANGVTVEIFGHRVAQFPSLTYRLHKGRAQARHHFPVIRPGYSRVSGFTLAQPLGLKGDTYAEVETTTRQGIRGRTDWAGDGPLNPYVDAEWKSEYPVRARRPVLVSRLPEAGVLLGRDQSLDISVGYMREHTTRTDAGRVQARWRRRIMDRGTKPGLSLLSELRAATYTTGSTYIASGLEASIGSGDSDVFQDLGASGTIVHGSTPFLFDRVQVLTEIFARKRIAFGAYRFEGGIWYDTHRKDVYDLQFAVGKHVRCIEPEFRYSSRRGMVYLTIRAAGFGPVGVDPEP
ncbi:MAG TPA: hypothetical protein VGM37_02270 [Armatimonadota bacterium]|jgi:lipopolysaccharide export system protein LptA